MPVYFIQAGSQDGPVKIGFSLSVQKRLVKMQADNHQKLSVLRVFHGGRNEEQAMHRRFSAQHTGGEWHRFTDEMLGDVGLTEIVPEAPDAGFSKGYRPPDEGFVKIFRILSAQWHANREFRERSSIKEDGWNGKPIFGG